MDFNEMIQAHHKNGATISIATLPVTAKEAPELNLKNRFRKNWMTSFIEKPAQFVARGPPISATK